MPADDKISMEEWGTFKQKVTQSADNIKEIKMSISGIHDTLKYFKFPCQAHEARLNSQEKNIDALEKKPSAVKAVIWTGSIVTLAIIILGVIDFLKG